ncbi:thermonuclease family protein [Mycobacterium lehmannii]|uniref:thermonuclease family protein n=1 Tax=Mycobacterium lehmannii TaxID=2048550 RepID=UPI000B93C167|nr:thermonuclease family protein [Mycobacterium lehmannii]
MRTTSVAAVGVVLMVIAPVSACAAPVDSAPATATVLRVVDADTVDVDDDVRGRLRVRVIDTPETKRPGYTEAGWDQQASDFAAATLLDQRVALVTDPTQDLHDRTLAYIQTAGGDFSVLAAGAVAGRSYIFDPSRPPQRAAEIAAAEASARQAGRGFWGPPCFGHTESQPR